MDSYVQTHEFPEVLVFKTELVRVVGTVVKSTITIWNFRVVSILIVENDRGNSRYFSAHIDRVFISGFPVLGFMDSTLVGFHEV